MGKIEWAVVGGELPTPGMEDLTAEALIMSPDGEFSTFNESSTLWKRVKVKQEENAIFTRYLSDSELTRRNFGGFCSEFDILA